MTKILAKSKGYVLMSGNRGEFLDNVRYRVIELDNQIRNYQNRGLIAELIVLEDGATDAEFVKMNCDKDAFLKKYKLGKTHEEKKEEAKEEKKEEKKSKKKAVVEAVD